jgi:CRP/FNR family transcriptional regulator, anaerobic regulatory protein
VRKHILAQDQRADQLAVPVRDFSALQAQARNEDPHRVPSIGANSDSAQAMEPLIERMRPSHRRRRHPQDVASPLDRGPSLWAVPFELASTATIVQLLSNPQQLQLAGIAAQLRLPAGTILHRQDSIADWVFIVSHGVAKTFHRLPSGKRRVLAFLFEGDLSGLAEYGRYVNTVQSLTPIRLYRIRLDRLLDLLRRDSLMDVQFLLKVTYELRASVRRTLMVSRRDAAGRLAIFLRMLDQRQRDRHSPIEIPMSPSDIASFLGLSVKTLIGASRRLQDAGLVAFDGRHAMRILDRRRLEDLARGFSDTQSPPHVCEDKTGWLLSIPADLG